MTRYTPVSHVIFDMDGTLLDTEKVYEKIFTNIVSQYGHNAIPPDIRMKMLGLSENSSCKFLIDSLKLPISMDEFKKKLHAEQKEGFTDIEMMPGVERLVTHLYDNNIPFACATSSTHSAIELKTKKFDNIFKYMMKHIVSGSDDPEVPESKPAPYVFLVCAKRFSDCPKPECCLVFEDAPNGVTAANRACMQVVMIPDPNLDCSLRKGATMVLNSMNDFCPELFNLPPYPRN